MADKRVFPVIDTLRPLGTRARKNSRCSPDILEDVRIAGSSCRWGRPTRSSSFLDKLRSTKSNADFFEQMNT